MYHHLKFLSFVEGHPFVDIFNFFCFIIQYYFIIFVKYEIILIFIYFWNQFFLNNFYQYVKLINEFKIFIICFNHWKFINNKKYKKKI